MPLDFLTFGSGIVSANPVRFPFAALRALACVAALLFGTVPAWASCPEPRLTPPEQVVLKGDTALIVVHATSAHDARYASKRGVDEAVRFAKGRGIPVVYLVDETPIEHYFMEDCAPDHWVRSQGGELSFKVTPRHVYIVGGHLELCLGYATNEIIYQWAQRPSGQYRITYLMDGIYSNGKVIDPSDPFYKDFVHFMGVVTYGRPGGEHWPKLSLLETMGVIVDEAHELDYLKQVLPRWDTTFGDEYRVTVKLNASVEKVLRSAPGWNPPAMNFVFLDSAVPGPGTEPATR